MKKNRAKKLLQKAYGRLFGRRADTQGRSLAAGFAGKRVDESGKSDGTKPIWGLNEELAAGSIRMRL